MQMSLWVNNIAYDIKTLRFFRIVSFVISLVLGLVGFYSYLMLYQTLLFAYGVHFMAIAYTPYVFCALIVALYQLLTGKRRERIKKAKRILMFSLLPICLMNTWGFITLVTWGLAWVMAKLEYNHRKRAVKIVSFFSKEYSPLFEKRLANRSNYYAYQSAYRLLDLIQVSAYEELFKEEVTEKDYKAGLVVKELHRTFKIKGVPFSKVTVTDKLYIAPQKMPIIGLRRFLYMVSYRFKRDGQYIQRELELDPLDEHQDQVYPESLEEQVDYSAFYDTYYDGFDEDSISREQEKKQGLIARGKERLSSVKEDVTDYYNLQVERHKDYYSDEDSFWMRKQQQKRNRKFIKQSIFLALGLLLVFGWYWLTALLH